MVLQRVLATALICSAWAGSRAMAQDSQASPTPEPVVRTHLHMHNHPHIRVHLHQMAPKIHLRMNHFKFHEMGRMHLKLNHLHRMRAFESRQLRTQLRTQMREFKRMRVSPMRTMRLQSNDAEI